jgi:AraC family transcriptional regulator
MDEELRVQRLVARPIPEGVPQTFTKQCLFKVVKRGVFDHGSKPDRMIRYRYASGDLILARRNTEEWVRWISETEMLMLELPDAALQDIADATGTNKVQIEGTPYLEDRRIVSLVEAVEAEQASGFPSGRVFLDSVATALAAALMQIRGILRRPLKPSTTALSSFQLRRITERIHAHIDQDLSVADLAEAAGLSTAYFSEAFRKSTGCPPHQFLLRARVERAKELLRTSDKTVIEVALACGFQSSQQLAKVFQRLLKATPTNYRREFAG